jgi:integrase
LLAAEAGVELNPPAADSDCGGSVDVDLLFGWWSRPLNCYLRGSYDPLRQRLIEDLTLRGYADRTIATYVGVVARLADFYHAAPDGLTEDQLRTYLLHLSTRLAPASITQALSGLRFCYEQTLGRRWTILDLARAKRDQKLPVVLSREEVGRVLAAVRVPAYRACLTTIYGCGLRLLEGITRHVQDIDGARGGLHIRRGKGGVDRVVPLPTAVLELLRAHWRTHPDPRWLFPAPLPRGQRRRRVPAERHLHPTTLQRAFAQAVVASKVPKRAPWRAPARAWCTTVSWSMSYGFTRHSRVSTPASS